MSSVFIDSSQIDKYNSVYGYFKFVKLCIFCRILSFLNIFIGVELNMEVDNVALY